MRKITLLLTFLFFATSVTLAKKNEKSKNEKGDTLITSNLVNGLKFRSIGPAWASGTNCRFCGKPG
jgi:preprotein translocase subunit SecG